MNNGDHGSSSSHGRWHDTERSPLRDLPSMPNPMEQRLRLAVQSSQKAVGGVVSDSSNDPSQVMRFACVGLKPIERRLLEGTVMVSQRRTPRLELVPTERAQDAEVIIVDTRDPGAVAWAQQQPWLRAKPVIWLDASSVPSWHTLLRRPVQWPVLPIYLARAMEQAGSPLGDAGHLKPANPDLQAAAQAAASFNARLPAASPGPASPGAGLTAADAASTTATSAGAQQPARKRVMVVDDSLAIRSYLRSQLEGQHYDVIEAADGRAALALAQTERFDVVLLDVLMPGMDGYEACRHIKSVLRAAARQVPVVMLTSKGSPFDRIRGKMAGCDAYLTKPISPAELFDVLSRPINAVPVHNRPAMDATVTIRAADIPDGLRLHRTPAAPAASRMPPLGGTPPAVPLRPAMPRPPIASKPAPSGGLRFSALGVLTRR